MILTGNITPTLLILSVFTINLVTQKECDSSTSEMPTSSFKNLSLVNLSTLRTTYVPTIEGIIQPEFSHKKFLRGFEDQMTRFTKYKRNNLQAIHKQINGLTNNFKSDIIAQQLAYSTNVPNSSREVISFQMHGVSTTIAKVGSPSDIKTEQVHLAIMDTGSHGMVFPLPVFPTTMKTFQPLETTQPMEDLEAQYSSKFYECPFFIKDGHLCTQMKYEGVGFNIVLGSEQIQFFSQGQGEQYSKDFTAKNLNMQSNSRYLTGYQLSSLYGNEESIAVVGLGVNSVDETNRVEYIRVNEGKENVLMRGLGTQSFSLGPDSKFKMGSIVLDYSHNTDDGFKWMDMVKGVSLPFVMFGGFVKKGNMTRSSPQAVLLDSGTNGLELTPSKKKEFFESIAQQGQIQVMDAQGEENMTYVCWKRTSNCRISARIGENVITFPLTGLEIFSSDIEGTKWGCTFINTMEERSMMNVLGYPVWSMFDVLFDGVGKRVGIKDGSDSNNLGYMVN